MGEEVLKSVEFHVPAAIWTEEPSFSTNIVHGSESIMSKAWWSGKWFSDFILPDFSIAVQRIAEWKLSAFSSMSKCLTDGIKNKEKTRKFNGTIFFLLSFSVYITC